MQIIHQAPLAALGLGAAFSVVWGVAAPGAAWAETQTYTGVGKCAMGDLVTTAQAKNYAREKALQNAKEQAGVYISTYSRTTNAKLAANEITAITNTITEVVGEVKYTQQPGEIYGEPVILHTATLTAKVDTDGIQKWLKQSDSEKASMISQSERNDREARESLEKIENLSRDYSKAGSEQEKEKIRSEFDEADRKLRLVQMNREALELEYKGDHAGAIQILRQITELDPAAATPWNNLGAVYRNSGDYHQAIKCLEKAISLDPDDWNGYVNLSWTYFEQKDWAGVAKYTDLALKHGAKNIGSYGNIIGYAYIQLDQPEKAIPYLQQSVSYNSQRPAVWGNLVQAYLMTGNISSAVKAGEQGGSHCPDSLSLWEWMSVAYYYANDAEHCIKASRKAIALGSESSLLWSNLSMAYTELEDYAEARKAAEKAIAIDSGNADAWYGLGEICYYQKDYLQAIGDFEKALSLNPKSPMKEIAWCHMGSSYAHSGNPAKGIECLLKAVAIDPEYQTAWNNLGAAANIGGEYEKAVEYCKKAIALAPNHPNAYRHLGVAYYHLGQYEEALAELNKALELKPGYTAAKEDREKVLQAMGR